MPDRSNMEASARQFVSMLEMLNVLSNQTRESISSFDGCSARSLGQVSRAELSDLKESLLAIEAEVYDLRVKLSQYSEIPAKAV